MQQACTNRSTAGLRTYLRAIGRFPKLDRGAELALARRFTHNGDAMAARAPLEGNLRYVPMIAARYRSYGIPHETKIRGALERFMGEAG